MLNSSNLTAPTAIYPVYTMDNTGIKVYPDIYGTSDISADYIRYPKAPKWTFISVGTNDPLFNPSALDYFEKELSKMLQEINTKISEIDKLHKDDQITKDDLTNIIKS
jgi:hypothetical protein